MSTTDEILQAINHRPYPLPTGTWKYYQEWNRALFLHWKVPFELLRTCVPAEFTLDSFEGNYYISLVAFTMEKIRPRYLPAVGFISNFDEINVRTYIENDGKKGVYFLSIEAGNALSAFIAKTLSGLPYEKSNTNRRNNIYESTNPKRGFHLHANYALHESIESKNELDKWLTERYCLYLDQGKKRFRFEIHHKEWDLKKATLNSLQTKYEIGGIQLNNAAPDFIHYSDGVQVIAWDREEI